jgi:Fe-S cluster assembly protein SufD
VSVLIKEITPEQMEKALAGYSEATVAALSAARQEPEWMLALRLEAWRIFEQIPWPTATDEPWRRTRLTGFTLDKFTPVVLDGNDQAPLTEQLQHELDEMETAASLVFQDGVVINRKTSDALAAQGVIFSDLRQALQEHPELVRQYFMTEVVKPDQNKFTALHAALWDTGAFVYVPKNVKVELPLQIILHQARRAVGGYHHTLLVAEEGAEVTVVDDLLGGKDGLQSAVVELYMHNNSVVRYMNLQDFDHSTWNFLTGRAHMKRDTDLRWIQVSWGSRLTKAFLDVDLAEPGGHGELLGIFFPTGRQHIDHQTLQLHRAPNCLATCSLTVRSRTSRAVSTWVRSVCIAARKRPMLTSVTAT